MPNLRPMQIKFSYLAKQDIIDHYCYGLAQFGAAQAESYAESLSQCWQLLARHPYLAHEHADYTPPVRIHHHRSHYVIYLIGDDHIFILRIVRDTVDVVRHLATE